MHSERTLLLHKENESNKSTKTNGLSVFFAIICIVDVFGIFPIVALPKAIIDCGYYGIIVVVVVCSTQIYTSILLGRCWIIAEEIEPSINTKNRYPYSALGEFAFGKKLGKFVTILVDITVFGAGIPNLIVASQNLQLLGLRLTNEDINISFCYWILVLGTFLCPILWLGSPKDMKCLCFLSVCIVVSVLILVNICLLSPIGEKPSILPEFNVEKSIWEHIFIAFGMVTFQFDIHPTILTIHVDMKDKGKISKVIISSFIISLGMFTITCINAYINYGTSITPSILETMTTNVFLHLATILVSVQLCLTSAISNSALYQHMEESLNISREFNQKRCILRTILIIMAIIIAESVPRFDIVMSLIGATLTSPLVFVLPPLIYWKILKLQDQHVQQLAMDSFTSSAYDDDEGISRKSSLNDTVTDEGSIGYLLTNKKLRICSARNLEISVCFLIIVSSLFCTLTATYLNAVDAVNFQNFSHPCIYNIPLNLIN